VTYFAAPGGLTNTCGTTGHLPRPVLLPITLPEVSRFVPVTDPEEPFVVWLSEDWPEASRSRCRLWHSSGRRAVDSASTGVAGGRLGRPGEGAVRRSREGVGQAPRRITVTSAGSAAGVGLAGAVPVIRPEASRVWQRRHHSSQCLNPGQSVPAGMRHGRWPP
jgi:hypothetical protein